LINTNKNFRPIKLSSKKILFFKNFRTILLLDYWRYAYTVKSRTHFAKAVLFSLAAGLFVMHQKHYMVL